MTVATRKSTERTSLLSSWDVCSMRAWATGNQGETTKDMDMFVIMGRVQGGGQSREATTNRRTSFSSFDVFKGTSD